jgi:uncharacterized damage-inducible protein DinB
MSFANPAATAVADGNTYSAALLALLGDRDPWQVMGELDSALPALVVDLTPVELHQPEAPGKWSALEVVAHLADTELVYRYRLRRIVAQPGTAISGYDQDAWARGLRYSEVDRDETLALIRALRTASLRWLRGLSSSELDRVGVHSERGEESVRHTVSLIAAHDLVHRAQLARIRRTIGR